MLAGGLRKKESRKEGRKQGKVATGKTNGLSALKSFLKTVPANSW